MTGPESIIQCTFRDANEFTASDTDSHFEQYLNASINFDLGFMSKGESSGEIILIDSDEELIV